MSNLSDSRSWKALWEHYQSFGRVFSGKDYKLEAAGISFDFSSHFITEETIALFLGLLEELRLKEKISDMFTGKKINMTEGRAALHTALRSREDEILVEGENVMREVRRTLARMRRVAVAVRGGSWQGKAGKPIRNIVNIGIGGSDLGPVMATEALKAYSSRELAIRFIANIDPAAFIEGVSGLDPEETLFLVASKSFTTTETLKNADAAKNWVSGDISKHFIALTADVAKAREFGVHESNILPLWDWVSGRYSMMGAIGLPIMIAIGPEYFDEMLAGAREVDEHFRSAEFGNNIPAMMAVLGVWYNNFFEAETHLVLPYSQYLHRFPAYLQQLVMESSGKPAAHQTGEIVWGEPGTNAQHSFMQLLHQGTKLVPVDFVGFENAIEDVNDHHKILMANMKAQREALKKNGQPSSSLVLERLTPKALGSLIALYEHKVFVEGIVWGINSFDQPGVELGKKLSRNILKTDTGF